MAENVPETRSLALTPTWSVATVLTIFVAVSLLVERSIHRLSNWLRKTNRKPLLAALEKMKEELMLLGFISLLLTATSRMIANICIPSKFYNSAFSPCTRSEIDEEMVDNGSQERKLLMSSAYPRLLSRMLNGINRNSCKEGYEPFVSYEGLEQLHRFIFVMAITHISYSCLTMLLAIVKSRDQHPDVNCASSEELCNSTDSPKRDKDRVGLQKEILESLFSFPQRSEEAPKLRRPVREISYRPYRRPVVGLLEDTTTVQRTTVVESQIVKEESDDDENSYKVLRRAVREHWITMKEYYRAAVDAFAKSDYARADRLLEQGHFYNKKAREADEKSAQKLLETNESNDDVIPLDLHEHEPKQALRLLKLHLTSLSGIHAIKYLRVIVGTGDEGSKGARKRLIIKQLEKSSIKWTEEDNGRTLRLQVDVIDPKSLSFAEKK